MERLRENIDQMNEGMEASQRREMEDLMKKRGFVILAWNGVRPTMGEERPEISVQLVADAPDLGLDSAAKRLTEKAPGQVDIQKMTLPIGEAVSVKTRFKTIGGDEVSEIRYIVMDGTDEYVLRLVATNGAEMIEPYAEKVAQSLRIKPKAS